MVQRYNKYLVNLQILCNFTHDDTHFSNFAGQHQMMKYTDPDRESNSELSFRRALLYPFNYQGMS